MNTAQLAINRPSSQSGGPQRAHRGWHRDSSQVVDDLKAASLACGGPSPWPLLHLHVRKGERVPRTCADCGRPVDQQGRVLAEHLKVVTRV